MSQTNKTFAATDTQARLIQSMKPGDKILIVVPVVPQPKPAPARFTEWEKGVYVPESTSGKVGIFTPQKYESPFGCVGTVLMVKETSAFIWTDKERDWHWVYRADGIPEYLPKGERIRWNNTKQARIASIRSHVVIEGVTAKRLSEVTEEEAIVSGIKDPRPFWQQLKVDYGGYVRDFQAEWDATHGTEPGFSVADDCFVWLVWLVKSGQEETK